MLFLLTHNELQENVERLKAPIPNGILYANDTFNVPTLNLTRARLVMQSMGFGDMGWIDAQWQAASFATWNYSYNIGTTPLRGLTKNYIIVT